MEDHFYKLTEVDKIAKKLLKSYPNNKLFTFTGDLGAGKTTLIQAICNELGVNDQVTSPTFSIINEYNSIENGKVFHMDLYRLKDENEALDIGIEDYLYSKNYTFVEWPTVVDHFFPEDVVRIHIENIDESTRKMLFL